VVAATFLELVAATEWFESPEIEGKTVAKVAMTTVPVEIAESGLGLAVDPYELRLPEVLTELIRYCEAIFIMVFSCCILAMFF
jgi:hypothetical protein